MNLILTSSLFFCPSILPCLVFVKSAEHFALCSVVFLFTNTKKNKNLAAQRGSLIQLECYLFEGLSLFTQVSGYCKLQKHRRESTDRLFFPVSLCSFSGVTSRWRRTWRLSTRSWRRRDACLRRRGQTGRPSSAWSSRNWRLPGTMITLTQYFWQTQVFRLLYNTLGDWP